MSATRGVLTVNLNAIADNWRLIDGLVGDTVECGAVVKSNAYGLGVAPIVKKLVAAGCRMFFVARVTEGVALHQELTGDDDTCGVRIAVLGGCARGDESQFIQNNLIPVLVSAEMFERWALYLEALQEVDRYSAVDVGCIVKINTGMTRFGLDLSEFESLIDNPQKLSRVGLRFLMSHLACADEPDHPLNAHQLECFSDALARLNAKFFIAGASPVKATLCNSSGVFLSDRAHYAMVRPGIALYGGNPTPYRDNPMSPVVELELPILQIRVSAEGELIGYGATCQLGGERTLAVVAGGYADGIFRRLGNACFGQVTKKSPSGVKKKVRVPMVGRVSMDTCVFDITDAVGNIDISVGDAIELIGESLGIDEQAAAAGTIGYEILTSLGGRYDRKYIG